jgi:Mor family transcriptional regulator
MANKNVKHLETLQEIIGESLFQEVIAEMPGISFRLPNSAEHFDKQQRNNQIVQDFYAGTEIDDLVKKYSLSRSRIYKIVESG